MWHLDLSVISENLPYLSKGLYVSATLAFWTIVGGISLGTPLGIARSSTARIPMYLAFAFIEIVRGTPILMLIFWVYFLLPRFIGSSVPGYQAGLAALIIFNSAYTAEIVRSGISAVARGQIEAGMAGGLRWSQIMRVIVLPQAFANMLPALMNQIAMVYKSTSLIFIIGVVEFFRAATIVNSREYKPVEIYLFVGLVYLVPCTLLSLLSRRIDRSIALRRGQPA